jgi:NAD(P)-dependent dehydrogenase (short-subunit alcohol dehydrogenase family)
MNEFSGKTAVVTGGASGIGKALAMQLAREGMSIVIADVEVPALEETRAELEGAGAPVLAVETDVSSLEQVRELAAKTVARFGAVQVLINNAGVAGGSSTWKSTTEDWEWVFGVNFFGVTNCLREFVPLLLEQAEQGHIVNVASIAGLLPFHPDATYLTSKHAVLSLSEHLYYDMLERGGKIGVSVLCPAWVATRIVDASRNRPAHLKTAKHLEPVSAQRQKKLDRFREEISKGMPPETLARLTVEAMRESRFYIIPEDGFLELAKDRFDAILSGENPPPWT